MVGSARNGQGDVSAVPRDHMSLLRVGTRAVSRAPAPCAPDTVFRVETDRGTGVPIDESGGKTVSGATPGVPKFEPRGGSTHSAFAPAYIWVRAPRAINGSLHRRDSLSGLSVRTKFIVTPGLISNSSLSESSVLPREPSDTENVDALPIPLPPDPICTLKCCHLASLRESWFFEKPAYV